jgi:hypothetical protein
MGGPGDAASLTNVNGGLDMSSDGLANGLLLRLKLLQSTNDFVVCFSFSATMLCSGDGARCASREFTNWSDNSDNFTLPIRRY